ncbi:rhodanese-like domain-containing protein [Persephonella sp.]
MKKISSSNIIFLVIIGIGLTYYLYLKGYIFSDFKNVDPKTAYSLISSEKEKIFLLDVRTLEEFENDGHIPGAVLIPIDDLPNQIDKIPKDKKVIVYCRSGMRSASASRLLSKLGYEVYNITGGIKSWKSERLPIEK